MVKYNKRETATTRIYIYVTAEEKKLYKKNAKKRGLSMSRFITEIIDEAYEKMIRVNTNYFSY